MGKGFLVVLAVIFAGFLSCRSGGLRAEERNRLHADDFALGMYQTPLALTVGPSKGVELVHIDCSITYAPTVALYGVAHKQYTADCTRAWSSYLASGATVGEVRSKPNKYNALIGCCACVPSTGLASDSRATTDLGVEGTGLLLVCNQFETGDGDFNIDGDGTFAARDEIDVCN